MIRFYWLILLFLTSCAVSPSSTPSHFSPAIDQSILTVYLSSSGSAEQVGAIRFEELAVEIDDVWIALDLSAQQIDYQEQKGQQLLLGASVVPPSEYRRLRLRVSKLLESEEAEDFYVDLAEPLVLQRGQSKCLFLNWQMLSGRGQGQQLQAAFTGYGQKQVLGGNLLYIACGKMNTVYTVRIDTDEVVSAFSVPGPLGEICLANNQQRLYLLSTGRRSIYVYDCMNERILDQILLSASIAPEYMVLSADENYAFVSDPSAGAVYKINLAEGYTVAQRQLGHRPGFLAEFSDLSSVAVSSSTSNQVFVLGSQDLSIQRSIQVGAKPMGLLAFDDSLYVAEYGSHTVSIYSPQDGRQLARISVGLNPFMLHSTGEDRAYVANSGERSLSVITFGQNMSFRRVATLSAPSQMVSSSRKRQLYVASAVENNIAVVSLGTEKVKENIAVAGLATSMAVLESRF